MRITCARCRIINAYNKPVKSPFTIVTAVTNDPIPYCDDWGDVMDNIPVVREKVDLLFTGICNLPCTC